MSSPGRRRCRAPRSPDIRALTRSPLPARRSPGSAFFSRPRPTSRACLSSWVGNHPTSFFRMLIWRRRYRPRSTAFSATAASPRALTGVFGSAGQDCCAGSRAFVHRSIEEEFDQRVALGSRQLRLGDPLDPATEVGPLISMKQRERVRAYVEVGQREGARLLSGGAAPGGVLARGSYLEPTVFDRADNRMRIAQEEIFGPVLTIIPFTDEDEVLRLVNDTPYGLSGSIWTKDIGRALRMARGVKTGVLSINSSRSVHQEAPFGGYKRSGIGRELGMHALQLYTEVKNVFVSLE